MPDLSSLYTYACDDVKFVRKGKPEAWITADKVNGAMYRGYPYCVNFAPGMRGEEEPDRYDDFVIDIDSGEAACADAIRIIGHYEQAYGIDPDQWRIYLSGKKGVHLELPATILEAEDGHILLPIAYKRLAKDIEGALGIKLDTSMYNRGTGKPYRQPNVMRDTGTCKRQIEYNELFEITSEEEYRAACCEPGRLWEPLDISRNRHLAELYAAYLNESVKWQEELKSAPKLTEEEIDRLAITRPPCINFLANVTAPGKTGATFNDIAMQLTAYAVTAGVTEHDFMGGCNVFIAGYPSTSLDTQQKREDNCRNRYRTMAANGNQFSCGGILALGFGGFDCEKCQAKPAGPAVTVEVMTADDIAKQSISLQIPPHILDPGGLISLGMQGLSQPGMPDIPQYNLPVVLTTIANAIASKIFHAVAWPNLFNIKVGPTSTGKSSSDRAMLDVLSECLDAKEFYGPTDFASGPGLLRGIEENPKCLIVIDEATGLFRRYDKADPVTDGKRDAILELFSKTGGLLNKSYSDKRQRIHIKNPCVSITGNVTPVVFDAIKPEDFETGLMQRFDFWCYDGQIPKRGIKKSGNPSLAQFAAGLAAILNATSPSAGNLQSHVGTPTEITATGEAEKALLDWSDSVIDQANAIEPNGERGIISRQYEFAVKYALIYHAATRDVTALFEPLDKSDIDYGKAVASMLCDWKLSVLTKQVSQGAFHKMCETVKNAIASAIQRGHRPTLKVIGDRRPAIKNLKPRELDEVIAKLLQYDEIQEDKSKRKVAYYLVKK